jgi:hypothetical protein
VTFTPAEQAAEDARAALWRAQVERRAAFQTELWASLAGDPIAAQRMHDAWEPLVTWLLERDEPDVEPEDDPGFDPLKISDTVNVGE